MQLDVSHSEADYLMCIDIFPYLFAQNLIWSVIQTILIYRIYLPVNHSRIRTLVFLICAETLAQ